MIISVRQSAAEQDRGGKAMKIWGKLWKDGHLLRDMVAEDRSDDTRTHKVFNALWQILDWKIIEERYRAQ